MIITNVTGAYFLKQNDTATKLRLFISEADGVTPVDLTTAIRVQVVIGVPEGRVLTKTPTILEEPGQLEFGLDDGDVLPTGDDRLEVHVFYAENMKRVAPSKGYYKLRIQVPIDELEVNVTTYTLDYFIAEVNRLTAGLPELTAEARQLVDDVKEFVPQVAQLLDDAQTASDRATIALDKANDSNDVFNMIVPLAETATLNANNATDSANTAATNANDKATLAQTATDNANLAATTASNAAISANQAAAIANGTVSALEDLQDDLQGYSIPIIDFTLGTTFLKGQTARFNGSTYRAKSVTQGNPLPVIPAVENEWWTLVAQRGVDGSGSVASVNGIQPNQSGDVILPLPEPTWNSVLNKPTVFPPSAHTHSWTQITAKPTEFTPVAHTHPIAQVEELQTTIDNINMSIDAIGQTGIPKLATYQYVVPATSNGQTQIEIPLDTFNVGNDTLFLYRNRTAQEPTAFSVTNTTITLNEPVTDYANTSFHIRILKNIPIGPAGSIDARVLLDGSIDLEKLAPAVQEAITNSTGTATNVAGLNREVAYLKLKQEANDRIEGGTVFADDFNGSRFGFTLNESESEHIAIRDGKLLMIDKNRVENSNRNVTVETTSVTNASKTDRRIAVLENGWIVVAALSRATRIGIYVSKDNGSSFTLSNNANTISDISDFCICPIKGTTKVLVFYNYSTTFVRKLVLDLSNDAATFEGIVNEETEVGSTSAITNPVDGVIHICWAAKKTPYASSFNIKYATSSNGGESFSTPLVITTSNVSTINTTDATIGIKNSVPIIVAKHANGSNYFITAFSPSISANENGITTVSGWGSKHIYSGTTYSQDKPSICVDKNGLLHVAWGGADVNRVRPQIRYSKSSDISTWSTHIRLTTDSNISCSSPSVTSDVNGDLKIAYNAATTASSQYVGLLSIKDDVVVSNITVSTPSSSFTGVSVLYDNNFSLRFDIPPMVYEIRDGVRYDQVTFTSTETPSLSATLVYDIPSTDYVGAFVKKTGTITATAFLNNMAMSSEYENNEYAFEGSLNDDVPAKLRIQLSRTSTSGGDSEAVSRILGGRS